MRDHYYVKHSSLKMVLENPDAFVGFVKNLKFLSQ